MLVPDLNPEPSALTPDLVPLGPHGYVQEVTAANVAPKDTLFPPDAIAKMDAACGAPQSLRALRVERDGSVTDAQASSWKAHPNPSPSPSPKPKPKPKPNPNPNLGLPPSTSSSKTYDDHR